MATFHRAKDFNEHLLYGLHDFVSYTYKLAFLKNITPEQSSFDDVKDYEIKPSEDYPAGGFEIQVAVEKEINTGTITITTNPELEFEFVEKSEPFRYIALYTPDHKHKPIVGYWDYGKEIDLSNEILKMKFDSRGTILTLL